MPQATYHFTPGFLWGSATAAHQVEGQNTNNNWYAWEQTPGKIHDGDKAGLACDWWGGRWKQDFDRVAKDGQNAHRLSIEWSRIQPAPDRWDENALEHYRQILRGCVQRKLTPMVTLHHFSDPLWLYERGGWEDDEAPALFEAFTRKVVVALKEFTNLWITINEPNIYMVMGYIQSVFPPGKRDPGAAFKVYANMLRGHAAAYRVIHALQPEAQVGIAVHKAFFRPGRSWSPLDRFAANFVNWNLSEAFNAALVDGRLRFLGRRLFVPEAAKTQDFLGLNYYFQQNIAIGPGMGDSSWLRMYFPPGTEVSETGMFANMPSGMFDALKWAHKFNLPIHITENGIEDSTDAIRPKYIVTHLHQVWRAINFNYPIKSYFHWSLVDNFEWERGWSQRFGLYGLDNDTQIRFRRPSAEVYSRICKANAISSEMVRELVPAAFPILFPE